MAKDFSYLEESGSGRKVAINPRHVRLIVEIDEKRVAVIFDDAHQILVDGSLAQISDQIRKSFD